MILIISEEFDATTKEVIDWLDHFQEEVVFVNTVGPVVGFTAYVSNNQVNINIQFGDLQQNILDLSKVKSVWYRKGDLHFDPKTNLKGLPVELRKEVGKHLYEEWECFRNFFFEEISSKPIIGNYFEKLHSKLSYLDIAKKCGFLIPYTFISNNLEKIQAEVTNRNAWITKTISDVLNIVINNQHYFTLTDDLNLEQIGKLPRSIFPSLIQEKILKKYELRIFFCDSDIFSAALFSQQSAETIGDFRANQSSDFRIVPVTLNKSLHKKISDFVNLSGLNTGSIDLIVSESDEIFFLEVNPSGQFQFISNPCNFPIEKYISEKLIALANEERKGENITSHD